MKWYYIDIGYAVFGVATKNDVIIKTAPIAKWMIGKTAKEVKAWLIKKKAKVIEI